MSRKEGKADRKGGSERGADAGWFPVAINDEARVDSSQQTGRVR